MQTSHIKQKIKTLVIQGIKFGFVGLINTAVALLTYKACRLLFHVPKIPSNIIAYLVGLTNSFFWNKFWTFKAKHHLKKREILFFGGVFFCSYLPQLGVFYLLNDMLLLNENFSLIIAMVVYTCINFLGNKFITFKKETVYSKNEI